MNELKVIILNKDYCENCKKILIFSIVTGFELQYVQTLNLKMKAPSKFYWILYNDHLH